MRAVLVAVSALALALVGLGAPAFGSPVPPSRTTFPWKGHDPACEVRLPIAGRGRYGNFTTCPPKRVLVVGDSVALTMGIQMSINQGNWGAIVNDQGIDGCGFVTGYDVQYMGASIPTRHVCDDDATIWGRDIRIFGPQAIVVEMGWWDSFEHVINGKPVDLTQPRYASLVENRILDFIHNIRAVTDAPIYFLSVPWMQPAPLPNGQAEPAASATSHDEINRLILSATQHSGSTHFVDISPYVTPAGYFQADVGGDICRTSDGVHFYAAPADSLAYRQTECGKALQGGVLSTIRRRLAGA